MKKILMLILLGVLVLSPLVSRAGAQWFLFQNPLLGKAAPEFSLENLSGQEKTFSDLRENKASMIFFWATWCPHCRTNLAKINKNSDVIKAKDIEIILVDLGEGASDVKKYLDRNGMNLDVFLDKTGDVSEKYGVQGIPTFVYVGANGIVKAVEYELLDDYEEVLLGE